MRALLHSCYRYYGKEHLLDVETPVSNDNSAFQVVNNEDGSVSVITDQAVVTFENRQNTEVWIDSHSRYSKMYSFKLYYILMM